MNPNIALTVLRQEIVNIKGAISVIIFAILFITFSLVVINLPSFLSFLTADYPLFTKIHILFSLFVGTFSATSMIDIFLVIVMGILFGINMTLLISKFNALKGRGNLRIMAGTGVVSLVAAGCASCGLSFASLIGISAVLTILPFGGVELYIVAIAILVVSIYFNLKQIVKVCKI